MSAIRVESEDIHNFEHKYQNALQQLNGKAGLRSDNKEKILEFLTHCKAKQLQKARQLFYLQHLTTIATILQNVAFPAASKADVENIFAELGDRKGRSGRRLEPWTIWGYKVTAKVFWRWLRGLNGSADPPETAWISTTMPCFL